MRLILTLSAVFILLRPSTLSAQIGGAFSVPGDFPTVSAAINTLNTMGIATGVTININAGHTETVIPGGLKLFTIAGASSSNQIFFRKSGTGANPLLVAHTGTAAPGTNTVDGVWTFIGTDYVTIDGVDILDPNTSSNAMMEFGFGFFRATAANGCQYNTIKNCVITLNRFNSATGNPGVMPRGACGILVSASSYTNNGSAITATTAAGAHLNCTIEGNLVRNCDIGMHFYGITSGTSDAFFTITTNTILNVGGGPSSESSGIRATNCYSSTILYNYVNNNDGNGSSPTFVFQGIYVTSGQGSITVAHNTVALSSSGFSSGGLSGIWSAVVPSGFEAVIIRRNVVSSISFSNATGGTSYGIRHSSSGGTGSSTVLDSNQVGNVNYGAGNFYALLSSGGATASVLSNTIENVESQSGTLIGIECLSSNSEIHGNYLSGLKISGNSLGVLRGITINGSPNRAVVNDNLLEHFEAGWTGSSPTASIIAINTGGASNFTVAGNIIQQVGTAPNTPLGISFTGINGNNAGVISDNRIHNVSSVATNTNATVAIYGIHISSSSGTLERNSIGNISFNSAGVMQLIRQTAPSSGTTNYYNNVLGNVSCANANNASALAGVFLQFASSNWRVYFYNNTVLLNSSAHPSLAFGSNAIQIGSTVSGSLVAQNNILANHSATGLTGTSRIYQLASTNLLQFNVASNNNLYDVGTPATDRIIAERSGATYSTLPLFQAAVIPADAKTKTEAFTFASTNATVAPFLALHPLVPTLAEGFGLVIPSITDDHVLTLRHPLHPDIGAWEMDYSQADVWAPAIVNSGFVGNMCTATGRTFTVEVFDSSGVATGSLSPRLYYRKNFTLYTSTQGTLVSGTPTTGVWSFNLTYSVVPSDVIHYFLVMQDQSAFSNLSIFPSTNASATDVNNITSPPIPANTYTISNSTMSGVYNVGAGQTFTTLTDAVNAYNTSCLTGPVTFSLTDAMYSANETFPIVVEWNTDASATNSLLIRPSTSATVIGSGAQSLLKLLNAHYVRIDGMPPSGSLTFSNNNTGTGAIIWLASNTGPASGNRHVAINGVMLRGSNNTSASNYAIVSCADGSSFFTVAGSINNDHVTITNNTIIRTGMGIYAVGSHSSHSSAPSGWAITGNTIGGVTPGNDNVGNAAIFLRNAQDFTITGNVIRNINGFSYGAITLSENVSKTLIHLNAISNVTTTSITNTLTPISGIRLGAHVGTTTVSANYVVDILNLNTSTSGYAAHGISCRTQGGAGNRIFNNMISNVVTRGNTATTHWPVGIALWHGTSDIEVDHNSVHLYGTNMGNTLSSALLSSAALLVNTTGQNLKIRNNILSNTYDFNNVTSDVNYAFYSESPASAFQAIDHNNYYVGGTGNNPVLAFLQTTLNALPAIQTAIGGNLASTTLQPIFVGNTDLHLQNVNGNLHLDNTGTPIAGITTDIDGQARSLSSPDIGADEFAAATCTLPATGTLTAANLAACSGQTINLLASVTNTDSGINHVWEVAVSPGAFSVVTSGTGINTTSYQTNALASGIYYYRMRSSCSVNGSTVATNAATVTITATPVFTASSSAGTLCAGSSFTLNGSASAASSFTWSGPGNFTSVQQNAILANPGATASGIYTLSGQAGTCMGTPVTVSVGVLPAPTVAVSGNTVVCAGVSASLTASGASSYSWSTGGGLPTTVLTPVATSFFTVTGTGSNGCSSERTFTIIVNPIPTVAISPSAATVCAGSGATLTASGANSYSWNTGANTSVLTVTLAVAEVFTVTGTSAGCAATQTVAVSTATVPVVSASASSSTLCAGSQLTLSATGADSYTWMPGNLQNAQVSVAPSTSTQYTLTGANSAGCRANAMITLTVSPLPVITAPNGTICNGNPFTIQPSGAASYTFSSGSAMVTPATNTSYSVYGTSSVGCIAANPAVVNVSVAPIPTISASGGTLCSGFSFTISPSGASSYTYTGGGPVVSPVTTSSYSVTGSNAAGCVAASPAVVQVSVIASPVISAASGSICSGQSFVINPSGAVTYTFSGGSATVSPASTTIYTVNGTNATGCKASSPASVTVQVSPIPTITAAGGSICPGQSFTIVSSGAASYSFSGGSQIVSPSTTTSYSVYGSSAAGCIAADPAVLTVAVLPPPIISVNSGTLCQGQSFTLTPTGASTYTYFNGGPIVSPVSNTNYSVIGSNAAGCVSTNTAVSQVSVTPSPTIAVNSGSICSGSSFTIVPSGAVSYSVTGNQFVVTPATTTNYSVTGADNLGCTSLNTAVSNVQVQATPTITAPNGSVCAGSVFTLNPSGALSYTFSSGSATVAPAVNSTYTITGSGAGGCMSNSITAIVNVVQLPTVTVNGGAVCAGQSFTLSPSGASGYTYSSGSAIVTPVSTSTFAVYGASAGCAATAPAIATVVVNSLPAVSISGAAVVCAGKPVTLTASGAINYLWNGTISGPTLHTQPMTTTVYTLTGTDANGCENTALATLTVTPGPALSVTGATPICQGESVNLFVTGTAITFTWSNGMQGNLINVSPGISTVYTVNATDISGCVGTATALVFVNNAPVIQANVTPAGTCPGGTVVLTGTGVQTYTWSGGVTNNMAFTPPSTNIYTVTGTAINGCKNSATVLVTVFPLPVISVAGLSDTICLGESVSLTASGAASYTWQPGNLVETTYVTTIDTSMTFIVTGTSNQGCKNTHTIVITPEMCVGLDKHTATAQINVYPTPFHSRFTVAIESQQGTYTLEVYNALSQRVWYQSTGQGAHIVDLSEYAHGIYYLNVYRDGRLALSQKVIKTE